MFWDLFKSREKESVLRCNIECCELYNIATEQIMKFVFVEFYNNKYMCFFSRWMLMLWKQNSSGPNNYKVIIAISRMILVHVPLHIKVISSWLSVIPLVWAENVHLYSFSVTSYLCWYFTLLLNPDPEFSSNHRLSSFRHIHTSPRGFVDSAIKSWASQILEAVMYLQNYSSHHVIVHR